MPWHVRVRKATLEQRATKESRKVSEYEREGDSTCRYEIELIAARCVRKSALPKAHDPVEAYIGSLAKAGRPAARSALNGIAAMITNGRADARTFAWELLENRSFIYIRNALLDAGYMRSSCDTKIYAAHGVLKAAWHLGLMDADRYFNAVGLAIGYGPDRGPTGRARLRPFMMAAYRRSDPLDGRELTMEELGDLFQTCIDDPTPAGLRDATAIALMVGYGLCPSEALDLDLHDYKRDDDSIRLKGKHARERDTFPIEGASHVVQAWLAVRGTSPGPLLCPVRRGGHIAPGLKISPQALTNRLKDRVRQAGIPHCSPKDLRRTYIAELLDAGVDYLAVMQQAGLYSVQAIKRYDRSFMRDQIEVAKTVDADLLAHPLLAPLYQQSSVEQTSHQAATDEDVRALRVGPPVEACKRAERIDSSGLN